jgi:hypothetical protein
LPISHPFLVRDLVTALNTRLQLACALADAFPPPDPPKTTIRRGRAAGRCYVASWHGIKRFDQTNYLDGFRALPAAPHRRRWLGGTMNSEAEADCPDKPESDEGRPDENDLADAQIVTPEEGWMNALLNSLAEAREFLRAASRAGRRPRRPRRRR